MVAAGCVLAFSGFNAQGTSGDRHVRFSALPHGWLFGIPRDTRQNSRLVGRVGGRRLAVSPTRNGNFCEAFQGVFAGCRGREAGLLGPSVIGRDNLVVAVGGDVVTNDSRTRLYVELGGREERVPLTWVSAPISAGFFYLALPRGVKGIRLVLKNPNGTLVGSSGILRAAR